MTCVFPSVCIYVECNIYIYRLCLVADALGQFLFRAQWRLVGFCGSVSGTYTPIFWRSGGFCVSGNKLRLSALMKLYFL